MPRAFYNDSDPYVCGWLRNLIAAGLLPDGDVDERPIQEITPDDLDRYCQVHLFAGIGGWALAARLARWPVGRPLWTASAPCQPFSQMGRKRGVEDERHLWPFVSELVAQCRPTALVGEQVASPAGREWFAGIRADLEGLGYAVGGADLCAASVGAPHKRQRLWWGAVAVGGDPRPGNPRHWLADRDDQGRFQRSRDGESQEGLGFSGGRNAARCSETRDWLGDADGGAGEGNAGAAVGEEGEGAARRVLDRALRDESATSGAHGRVGDAVVSGLEGHARDEPDRDEPGRIEPNAPRSTAAAGLLRGSDWWSDYEWIAFPDGQTRRIEPGTSPVVDGFPGFVDQLRAFGNAIVPELGAVWLETFEAIIDGRP